MPPRWVILVTAGFWAGTMGWMFYREVVPRLRSGEPPPLTIDITDEISTNPVHWDIWGTGGDKIGIGVSSIRRRDDRTFEFGSRLEFNKPLDLFLFQFKRVVSKYRVTAKGELLEYEEKISLRLHGTDREASLSGRFENGYTVPTINFLGGEVKGAKIKARRTLDPMHLLHKWSGLYEGQEWEVPYFDLLASTPGKGLVRIPRFRAHVTADGMSWNGQNVSCFKIEYHEPDKKPTARTWVRRRDGLILKQEALFSGIELIMLRQPNK